MSDVAKIAFTNYDSSIPKALDTIRAYEKLPREGLILIKPNLTNSSPPPVTTPVEAVGAVYKYCREHSRAEIAIAEGSGTGSTHDVFAKTGYTQFAAEHEIRLIDFNEAPSVKLRRDDALHFKEFYLPEIALGAFIISLPVLKDHGCTVTTVSMKNMFGLAPGRIYGGAYNKSKLHSPSTHKSVFDVCLYKPPDLCVVDASVVLSGSHLSGTHRKLGLILASFDPVAVDTVGSELLGHDPTHIEYLTLANGLLGDMHNIRLLEGD